MKQLTILDWKSGKNVLDPKFNGYAEHFIQVPAYMEAHNQAAIPEGKPAVTQGGIVYLDKVTGDPRPFDATEGWEERYRAFTYLRQYYRLAVEPFVAGKRFYDYKGDKFPSVTTILGVLDKPALIYWAANCAVECVEENLPEIRNPKTNDMRIKMILDDAKKNFRKKSKVARDTGTLIHDAIQIHLAGGDPSKILDGNDAAQNGFLAFLEWAKSAELEPVALEVTLYNPAMRYAGTADFLGYANLKNAKGMKNAAA